MGLDMFLNKTLRVDGVETAREYALIDTTLDYLDSKREAENSRSKAPTLDEYGLSSEKITEEFIQKANMLEDQHISRDKFGFFKTIWEEVGYWKKDNHIHNWFVENIQNGDDDCGYYEVSEEKLRELLQVCEKVVGWKPKRKVLPHFHRQGCKAGLRRREDVPFLYRTFYKEKPLSKDRLELLENLLPTTSGFFFGSVDYDTYYFEGVEETIKIIKKSLSETDFEKEILVYHSSW